MRTQRNVGYCIRLITNTYLIGGKFELVQLLRVHLLRMDLLTDEMLRQLVLLMLLLLLLLEEKFYKTSVRVLAQSMCG